MKKLLLLLSVLLGCSSNPGNTPSEKIHSYLQKRFNDGEFVGNVLVAGPQGLIYKGSFGYSDKENSIKNQDSTQFLIASISKPITSIVILRLVDQGTIQLTDPVNKYFPASNAKVGAITIHQLLTHTSGINEFIGKDLDMNINSLLKSASLEFAPGSDFKYSNSGYVLLKEIAQIATQRSYPDLLRDEVFEVAGMSSSGVARNIRFDALAKGYTEISQSKKDSIDFPLANVDGAGSIYSTVIDLMKLDSALYTDKLLSNEMKMQMLAQQVKEKYGYGWFIRERRGKWSVYWHKGDLPGFSTYISRNVERSQLIIILSNATGVDVADIEQDIYGIIK